MPKRTATTSETTERVKSFKVYNVQHANKPSNRSFCHSTYRFNFSICIVEANMTYFINRELKFHPYKLAIVLRLKSDDYRQCSEFVYECRKILSPQRFFKMSKLSLFAAENPRNLHGRPLYNFKVFIWCAVLNKYIIGHYSFEEQGNIVTVNRVRYIDMLYNFSRLCGKMLVINSLDV